MSKSQCSPARILIVPAGVGLALGGMRALIRATQPLRRFEPAGDAHAWAAAARRI